MCSLVFREDRSEFLLDVRWIWFCIFVCAHEVESREQCGFDALFLHVVCNHVGAHHLALCHDVLFLEAGEELFGERAQILEFLEQEGTCGLFPLFGRVEFLDVLHVFLFEFVDYLVSAFGILFVEIVRDLQERVCRSRHGREHYEHLFA